MSSRPSAKACWRFGQCTDSLCGERFVVMASFIFTTENINVGWDGHMFAFGSTSEFRYDFQPYPDPTPRLRDFILNWRISSESSDSWQFQKVLLETYGFSLPEDGNLSDTRSKFQTDRQLETLGVSVDRYKALDEFFEREGMPVGDFRIWDDEGIRYLNLTYYLPSDYSLWSLVTSAAALNGKLEFVSTHHYFADREDAPAPTVDSFLERNQALFIKRLPVIRLKAGPREV